MKKSNARKFDQLCFVFSWVKFDGSIAPCPTLKMRKCHKNWHNVYTHTYMTGGRVYYTIVQAKGKIYDFSMTYIPRKLCKYVLTLLGFKPRVERTHFMQQRDAWRPFSFLCHTFISVSVAFQPSTGKHQ